MFCRSFTVRMSFLRASGGVSTSHASCTVSGSFSPRKRRCFLHRDPPQFPTRVFSAQAEVFPIQRTAVLCTAGFLRASGGVSLEGTGDAEMSTFSPRKRRCFSLLVSP